MMVNCQLAQCVLDYVNHILNTHFSSNILIPLKEKEVC